MFQRMTRLLILTAIVLTAVITLYQQQKLMAGGDGNSAAVCVNGTAAGYPCHNINLLSFTPKDALGATVTDSLVANLWGWTDPETGKEYVMLGLDDSTAFIDVSNPLSPTYLGALLSHNYPITSPFRDMKVYQDYAFIVADSPSQNGMQVFDLTSLRGITTPTIFSETAHYDEIADGHNIFINEDTGYAYIARRSIGACGGVTMVNIQDPLNPVDAGCYEEGDVASDSMCVLYHGPDADYQGREICVIASDDNLVVGDVTSKTMPVTITDTLSYANATRIHSVWFTEDHRYFLSADMMDEHHWGYNTRIFIWDASDLNAIPEPMLYTGPTTGSDHNIWVRGDYAYVGNLSAGLRILDLRSIDNGQLTQAAYFDDYPTSNAPGHEHGTWAVYPFFESGVVAMSNREEGLFLVRPLLKQTFLPIVSGEK
jgi:choice-of-anchor B domain-containing protein